MCIVKQYHPVVNMKLYQYLLLFLNVHRLVLKKTPQNQRKGKLNLWIVDCFLTSCDNTRNKPCKYQTLIKWEDVAKTALIELCSLCTPLWAVLILILYGHTFIMNKLLVGKDLKKRVFEKKAFLSHYNAESSSAVLIVMLYTFELRMPNRVQFPSFSLICWYSSNYVYI